jgi:uncharacterized protein YjbI with pentapeptide repeats
MSRRSKPDQLRDGLQAFIAGDRSPQLIDSLVSLVYAVDEVPWRDELGFVLRKYDPGSDATGDVPLTALAEMALNDWATKPPEPRWRLQVPDDARGLQARWTGQEGEARAAAVAAALHGQGSLAPLAFGTYAGRLDLRGFQDPGTTRRGIGAISLSGVDLSGARIDQLTFSQQTITNCRFDGATFHDFRLWSSSIADSTFRGADLGDGVLLSGRATRRLGSLELGKAPAGRHARVDFSGARLAYARFRGGGFADCDFSNAKLHQVAFECDLLRCRFAGHLHETSFFGRKQHLPGYPPDVPTNRLQDVDLRGADLHWIDFRDIDLDAFRLPDSPRIRVISNWPCVQSALETRFPRADDQPRSVGIALILGNRQEDGKLRAILEMSTVEEEAGRDARRDLDRILDEIEASCGDAPIPAHDIAPR